MTKKIKAVLGRNVTHRAGVYTYRRGYFYRMGSSAAIIKAEVETKLAAAGIPIQVEDYGDQFKPFRGGTPLAKSSHFWVKFKLTDAAPKNDTDLPPPG